MKQRPAGQYLNHRSDRPTQVRQAGQSMLEYVAVCAVLAFALFVPISGDAASPDGARTTVQIVLNEFQQAYRNISYAISLPN